MRPCLKTAREKQANKETPHRTACNSAWLEGKGVVLCIPQVYVEPSPLPTLGQWCSSGGHAAGHPQGGTASDRSQLRGQREAS